MTIVSGALRQRAEALHEDNRAARQGPQGARQVAAQVEEPTPESLVVESKPPRVGGGGRQPAVCRGPVHGLASGQHADGRRHASGHARAERHGHAAAFLTGLDWAAVPRSAGVRCHDGHCRTPCAGTLQQWLRGGRRHGSGRRVTFVGQTTDVNP